MVRGAQWAREARERTGQCETVWGSSEGSGGRARGEAHSQAEGEKVREGRSSAEALPPGRAKALLMLGEE